MHIYYFEYLICRLKILEELKTTLLENHNLKYFQARYNQYTRVLSIWNFFLSFKNDV